SARAPRTISQAARSIVRTAVCLCVVGIVLLPVSGFIAGSVGGLAATAIVTAMVFAATARPGYALLVCAALAPLGWPLAIVVGSPCSLGEPLVLAFLGGWLLRETVPPRPRRDPPIRGLVVPALLLSLIVVGSIIFQLLVAQVSTDYPWPYARQIITFIFRDSLAEPHALPALAFGALLLEGVGLFVATLVLLRRQSSLVAPMLRMLVAGGIGVALLNVYRLIHICMVSPQPLLVTVRTARVAYAFPDLNAAGSYLAMMALLAVGLATVSESGPARAIPRSLWFAGAAVVLMAMWMTGSRAALYAAPFAGLVVATYLVRVTRKVSMRSLAAAVVLLTAALVLVAWLMPRDTTYRGLPVTVQWRIGQWAGAIRAFESNPVFGIGVGQFWNLSPRFFDPELRRVFPHENAHNNFLQILAELGFLGLVAFLWLLVAIGRRAIAALGTQVQPFVAPTAAGVLAFLLTCLVSHPLLVVPVSHAFWLVLGVLAALSLPGADAATGDDVATRGRGARLLWVAIACLGISVPLRASHFVRTEANLDNVAIGFASRWEADREVGRARTFVERATFYVPGGMCTVTVPLRVVEATTRRPVYLDVLVDGRQAARVRFVDGIWRRVDVPLHAQSGARFLAVEVRTFRNPSVVVQVGKPVLAGCDARTAVAK
ncbi:MAG: O-antigen ligase family protein, partial [Bacteroidales bacterium]